MKYQFQVDGRSAGPIRDSWARAAQDAVSSGYAVWIDHDEIRLSDEGEIVRIQ